MEITPPPRRPNRPKEIFKNCFLQTGAVPCIGGSGNRPSPGARWGAPAGQFELVSTLYGVV